MPAVLARHPEALRTLPANIPALRPPGSYATIPYYAVHAYRFVDADGRLALRPLHARAAAARVSI